MALFLARIAFYACKLNLMAVDSDDWDNHIPQMLPFVSERLREHFFRSSPPTAEVAHIRAFSLDASPDELVIQGFEDTVTSQQILNGPIFSFTLDIRGHSSYPPEHILENFIDSIPLRGLEVLTVSVDDSMDFELSAPCFRNRFGIIQTLRSIELHSEASPFFAALLPDSNMQYGTIPFPALSTVTLSRVDDFSFIESRLRERSCLPGARPLDHLLLGDSDIIPEQIILNLETLVHCVGPYHADSDCELEP
jgi:hypothetical protein